MAAAVKHEVPKESPLLGVLSGWGQQAVQTLFATQHILLDLAMRQNASIMHAVRQQLSDPHHSPAAILSEVAEDGIANFLDGQHILLELGKQQNELLMKAVKERLGDTPQRAALINLLQRSVETFIHMDEEYLKMAGKQTRNWLQAVKAGKPYEPEHMVDFAREGMETFVKAQKRFLDVVADETAKITSGKHGEEKRGKKTEIPALVKQAMESFVEAQKQLVDTAGRQMNSNVKVAGKSIDLLKPFPFLPLNELTRGAVKSYVDAQKALMNVMVKPVNGQKPAPKTRAPRKPMAKAKAAAAVA
ncbi:MAG TPA: hypothetical protein VKQ11_01580 [Candidatus Sulfotelmatobacter sp.]|nr:hypothetical protein [Candidatus Sulfotelmatobacter sp.]